jgi:hypothetical protein
MKTGPHPEFSLVGESGDGPESMYNLFDYNNYVIKIIF